MPLFANKNPPAVKTAWAVAARRAGAQVRITSLLLAMLSLLLGVVLWALQRQGIEDRSNVTGQDPFVYLVTTYEPLMLTLASAGFLVLCALTRWRKWLPAFPSPWTEIGPLKLGQVAALSLFVVVLVGLGRHFVYLDYDGCADEILAHFQSEILASGHILGKVPQPWQAFNNVTTVPLLTVLAPGETWAPGYLPIHSLLRAPLVWLGADGYACAFFLGLNLVLFYSLLRQLWPHHPTRAAVGLLLFAFFPQVLITSMSSYAMETHALLATIWLLLYISTNPKIFLLTPWLGVLWMGIHQPHIYPILAAPFILRLALEKCFFEFFYFCAVSLAGAIFWLGYLHLIRPGVASDGLSGLFGFNALFQMILQSANVALLLAWSPLLLPFLFVLACVSLRPKDSFVLCCLFSVILLAALHFLWRMQGHGWGDRYLYPAIPFVIIISVQALGNLRLALGRRAAMNLVVFSTLFVWAVALPYRAWEVHRFEHTGRAAHDVITRTDADVVLLDTEKIWYGLDLVQNNPSLDNRPIVLSLLTLTPGQLVRLKQENLSLKILGLDDLRATGLPAAFVREQD